MDTSVNCGLNPIVEGETQCVSNLLPKNRLMNWLDEVEKHIELMRRDLLLLEEKKDTLLTTLDTIRQSDLIANLSDEDSTEVEGHVTKLVKLCSAIDIKVNTSRDERQEEALYQVNRLIDSLVIILRSDAQSAYTRCLSYVTACTGNVRCKAVEIGIEEEEESEELPPGGLLPDAKFEEMMFLCTSDDRKRVQRRLQGLLAYIEREMGSI